MVALRPDGPAAAAGVLTNDVIIAVNGESTAGKSTQEVLAMWKGTDDFDVTVLRQDQVETYRGTQP